MAGILGECQIWLDEQGGTKQREALVLYLGSWTGPQAMGNSSVLI